MFTSAYLRLGQDLQTNFHRGPLIQHICLPCITQGSGKTYKLFFHQNSINQLDNSSLDSSKTYLLFFLTKVHQFSKICPPPHNSDLGKTYLLFLIEVHQLANLFTSPYLKLRQDLQSVFHRNSSISESLHPYIT